MIGFGWAGRETPRPDPSAAAPPPDSSESADRCDPVWGRWRRRCSRRRRRGSSSRTSPPPPSPYAKKATPSTSSPTGLLLLLPFPHSFLFVPFCHHCVICLVVFGRMGMGASCTRIYLWFFLSDWLGVELGLKMVSCTWYVTGWARKAGFSL